MTPSQANKLGERLRSVDVPSEADLRLLQEFRAAREGPLTVVQARISNELGVPCTGRLKTVNTTIEKLKRDKTRLSRMQDIAGVRVTLEEGGLSHQSAIAAQIGNLFPDASVVDIRGNPHQGYRAVHVIVGVDDCTVEIQVRTKLQDSWAQSMEKLADKLGRGIRYGETPTKGEEALAVLLQISAGIQTVEQWQHSQSVHEERRRALDTAALPDARRQDLEDLDLQIASGAARLNEALRALPDLLTQFNDVVGQM